MINCASPLDKFQYVEQLSAAPKIGAALAFFWIYAIMSLLNNLLFAKDIALWVYLVYSKGRNGKASP